MEDSKNTRNLTVRAEEKKASPSPRRKSQDRRVKNSRPMSSSPGRRRRVLSPSTGRSRSPGAVRGRFVKSSSSHGRERTGSGHVRDSLRSPSDNGSSHGRDRSRGSSHRNSHVRERLTSPGDNGNNCGSNHVRDRMMISGGNGRSRESSHVRERLLDGSDDQGGERPGSRSKHGRDRIGESNHGKSRSSGKRDRLGGSGLEGKDRQRGSSTSRRNGRGSNHSRERSMGIDEGSRERSTLRKSQYTDEDSQREATNLESKDHRTGETTYKYGLERNGESKFRFNQRKGSTGSDSQDQDSGSEVGVAALHLVSSAGPRISWKSDPKASFCDWRIEIVHLSRNNDPLKVVDIYNVHRNVVGYGPRKSNFMRKEFIRQIEDRNYGSGSNITKINLPYYQADAFPLVLDFIYYTKEAKQSLTAEKACHVFQIAEILDIPPLGDALVTFYEKNLSEKNMSDFMASAIHSNAERLLFASRAKIGSLIMEKPDAARLLLPKYMVDILEVNKEQVRKLEMKSPYRYPEELKLSHSRVWSKAAYACVSSNTRLLQRSMFDAITHEDCLPSIDCSVAVKFLILASKFYNELTGYATLRERCVASLTGMWDKVAACYSSPEEFKNEIEMLPPELANEVLAHVSMVTS